MFDLLGGHRGDDRGNSLLTEFSSLTNSPVDFVNCMVPMPPSSLDFEPNSPRDVRDILMFRIARLATIIDRTGQLRLSRLFKLNLGEWRVLSVIHALAPVTLAEIARELCLDKGHLSRTVSLQVAAGLVSDNTSPSDRRQALLALTAKGRRLHDRVFKFAITRHVDFVSALSAPEQKELFRLLDKVTATAANSYNELFAMKDKPVAGQERSAVGAPAKRALVFKKVGRASARNTGS